jgi:hypothetical protein
MCTLLRPVQFSFATAAVFSQSIFSAAITTWTPYIEAMLQRALLLACMLAMAQAQAKHIVYYNPSDECKNELCWQCALPLICPFTLISLTCRPQIPYPFLAHCCFADHRGSLLQVDVCNVRHLTLIALILSVMGALASLLILA